MLLRELNKINNQSTKPATQILHGNVDKPKGKIMDRIGKAKTKGEKKEIIEEWILCEIKKINKDSEMCDF